MPGRDEADIMTRSAVHLEEPSRHLGRLPSLCSLAGSPLGRLPSPCSLAGSPLVPANRNFSLCTIHPVLTHQPVVQGTGRQQGWRVRPGWKGEVKGSLRSEAAWLIFCLHPTPIPERSANRTSTEVWEPPGISPAQAALVQSTQILSGLK